MTDVLFVAPYESRNLPRRKTKFLAFIELRIVEQCKLLHLRQQPRRNSRLFYAQCGSKSTADLFGCGVSLAHGWRYRSRITRPYGNRRNFFKQRLYLSGSKPPDLT